MLKNPRTDLGEFRRMVEKDAVWFFRLLQLSPEPRLLLPFGPIVRADGSIESLVQFLTDQAPQNGSKLFQDGKR